MSTKNLNCLSYVWQMWKRLWLLKFFPKFCWWQQQSNLYDCYQQSNLETEICIFGRKRNGIISHCGDCFDTIQTREMFWRNKKGDRFNHNLFIIQNVIGPVADENLLVHRNLRITQAIRVFLYMSLHNKIIWNL